MFVWLLIGPAFAVDGLTALFVGGEDGLLSVLDSNDLDAGVADSLTLDAAATLASDPAAGVLYTRDPDSAGIFAYDLSDLSALPDLDIAADAGGGAMDIDPFRRMLFTVEADGSVLAWSLAFDDSYGTLLGTLFEDASLAGTTSNQLVRDPASNTLYAAPAAAGGAVLSCSLRGVAYNNVPAVTAQTTTVTVSAGGSLSFDGNDTELLLHTDDDLLGVSRFKLSDVGALEASGSWTNREEDREDGLYSLHWVTSGAGARLVESSGSDGLRITDISSGLTTTIDLPGALALEYYPLSPVEVDDDHDGLPDSVEVGATGLGDILSDQDPTTTTDPDDDDTDDDGLLDGEEDLNEDGKRQDGESDPTLTDTDGDGLSDGDEVLVWGSSPVKTDTDGDGLLDIDEVSTYGTDPASPDTDSDGLEDRAELEDTGTDPTLADTDGDGIDDRDELNTTLTDPLDTDTDDDGLGDGAEVNVYSTDPLNPDTDGDGRLDGDEVDDGTDPLVADAADTADSADSDSAAEDTGETTDDTCGCGGKSAVSPWPGALWPGALSLLVLRRRRARRAGHMV